MARFFPVISLFILLISSCQNDAMVDPYWSINLNWDKQKVLETLNKNSRSGKIENNVFSYGTQFFVKSPKVDARITSNLNMPVFQRDELKSISYSLLVEFKNQKPLHFNQDFYSIFKDKMVESYGDFLEESSDETKVILNWQTKDKKSIKVTILKEINHYSVDIDV